MSDSILLSTKKALDIPENYDVFDGNIIMHINTVFSTLTQLGIGPADGFQIEDDGPTWTQYLKGNVRLNIVKTYMYLRVRLLFDPPGTSFLQDAMKEQIKEFEWRINTEHDYSSTVLLGGTKKITGNIGDEYRIRLTNPPGKNLINSTGTYEATFVSRDGSRQHEAVLDVSQKANGVLYLNAIIRSGIYTVRRVSPRRTVLVLDVSAL